MIWAWLALLLCAAPIPALAALAFVTNQGDDTVSVVDTARGVVTQTVSVGSKPAGIALGAGARRVYVTNPEGHSITILERTGDRLSVVREVPAGAGPLGVAVSPTDGRVFAADWYGDTVAVMDADGAPLGAVHVGQSPSGVAVDAAGTRLYVANRESDNLSVIDLATLTTVATIPVGHAPFGVTLHGGRVFVANVQSGDVSVLDMASLAEIRRVKVGEFPYAVAVTPDGSRLLVTNQHSGTLSVFDADFTKLPDITVGDYPEGIAMSEDGTRAFVAVWMDNRLAEIDVAAGKMVRKIKVGESPRAFGLFLAALASTPAAAQPVPSLAAFDFTINNTSPAATTPDEFARLHRLDAQFRAFARNRFTLTDMAPVQERLTRIDSIRGCNGCEMEMGQALGADQVAYGWVQKVSNLILNVNLVIEDAKTGQVLHADSVDIRGNTDESWMRGLRYLLNERMFRE